MKALQTFMVGFSFTMGLVFIFDGGPWQQPLGAFLVMCAVSEITWLLYTIAEKAGVEWNRRG